MTGPLFLHILAFACGRCALPLPVTTIQHMSSLEDVDAALFDVKCACGWRARLSGLQARQHWVGPWTGYGAAA